MRQLLKLSEEKPLYECSKAPVRKSQRRTTNSV
jgi:hypothetical protein